MYPVDYRNLIEQMTPEVYRNLQRAVELGKWPDGRALTAEQKATCMQAIIAWGESHLPEQERVGFIDRGHKDGDTCDDPQPLNWKE